MHLETIQGLDLKNCDSTSSSAQDVPYSDDIKAIVSTALLITGNTVGTGTLVLPEVASRLGGDDSNIWK